jgi:hypothetical protein
MLLNSSIGEQEGCEFQGCTLEPWGYYGGLALRTRTTMKLERWGLTLHYINNSECLTSKFKNEQQLQLLNDLQATRKNKIKYRFHN